MKKFIIKTVLLSAPLFCALAVAQPTQNLKYENFTDNFTVSLNFLVPTTIAFISTSGHLHDDSDKPAHCDSNSDKCYFSVQDDGEGPAIDDNGYITYKIGDSSSYCQFTIYDGAATYAKLDSSQCSSGLKISNFQEQGNEYTFSIVQKN